MTRFYCNAIIVHSSIYRYYCCGLVEKSVRLNTITIYARKLGIDCRYENVIIELYKKLTANYFNTRVLQKNNSCAIIDNCGTIAISLGRIIRISGFTDTVLRSLKNAVRITGLTERVEKNYYNKIGGLK